MNLDDHDLALVKQAFDDRAPGLFEKIRAPSEEQRLRRFRVMAKDVAATVSGELNPTTWDALVALKVAHNVTIENLEPGTVNRDGSTRFLSMFNDLASAAPKKKRWSGVVY